MYWEGQKEIEMDNKDEDHYDESIYEGKIVPIDEKSMHQAKKLSVEGGFG